MESYFTEEKMKTIEDIVEQIKKDISIRNEKYELESKKLKEDYINDLDVLEDSKFKLKENFNALKELKENMSSNILVLLKIKNELDFVLDDKEIKGVYSFGYNTFGQLGLGNTINPSTPQLISSLENEKIKNFVCGSSHAIFCTSNLIFY
jgi:alpha-tubulin suppressor-like RCC1 family protein